MKYLWLLPLFLCSCTHSVHIVNFSDQQPYTHGRPVHSQSEQFVVLGFNFDDAYVNQAFQQLTNECETGRITAITTKYYTDHGFFSWTNRLEMDGICLAD